MGKVALLILISITVLGCNPLYYVPNSHNVPMMKEKGQTNLSASYGGSGYTHSFEFQSAYGLTNKIALQFNGFSATSKNETGNMFKGSGTMLEFGAGYYKSISPMFVFETYGLADFGDIRDMISAEHFTPESGIIKANFLRVGLQPSMSFTRKHFAASISSRVANLSYNHHSKGSLSSDYLDAHNSYWLLEPALTLQAGFEDVKLQIQYVYSFNLTDPNFSQDVDHLSLGLILNLHPKKRLRD